MVFVSAIVLAAGCSEKPNRYIRLVVYSPHGKEILEDFEHRFEFLHQNDEISIDVVPYQKSSQMILQQLLDEKTTPSCDVWWGGSTLMFMKAKEEGLLDTCPRAEVAAYLHIDHRDPQYYWLAAFLSPVVIIYNQQRVPAHEAPKDWDDLLDPKWKGKIIIRDPLTSESMQIILSALIYRFYRETGSPDAGYDWLRKLDTNIFAYADSTEGFFAELNTVTDATVGVWLLPDVALQRRRYDYRIDYVIPESGTPVLAEGVALVRGSQRMETAKTFIDFITSRESQLHLADPASGYYRIPSRNDMKEVLPEWLRDVDIDSMLKAMPIDWNVIQQNQAEWVAYWKQNIRLKGRAKSETGG
ncbi:MAG: extracellular solute-binding protein [bacterium]